MRAACKALFIFSLFLSPFSYAENQEGIGSSIRKNLDSFYSSLANSPLLLNKSCEGFQDNNVAATTDCAAKKEALIQMQNSSKELQEGAFFTKLAIEKKKDVDCALDQVTKLANASGEEFEFYLKDAYLKATHLAQKKLKYLKLSNKAYTLSYSRNPETKKELVETQKKIKEITLEIAGTGDSLPFHQSSAIEEVIRKHTQLALKNTATFKGLSDPNSKPEIISEESFKKDYQQALQKLKVELQHDQKTLSSGVQSLGQSFDRSIKEVLMQDGELLGRLHKQEPAWIAANKKSMCEMKNIYNVGAIKRDKALMAGSIAVSVGSLGVGLLGRGTVTLMARSKLIVDTAKGVAVGATFIGRFGAALDLMSGIKSSSESCLNQHFTNKVSGSCEKFSLQNLEETNCKLSLITDFGAQGIGLAVATTKTFHAVSAKKLFGSKPLDTDPAWVKSGDGRSSLRLGEDRIHDMAQAEREAIKTDLAEANKIRKPGWENVKPGISKLESKNAKDFIKDYGSRVMSTEKEMQAFNDAAKNMKKTDGYTCLEFESAIKQFRNNTTGRKDLVDAMDNRMFELMQGQIKKLSEKYPGLNPMIIQKEVATSTDYKSFSLVIKGDISDPKLRKELDALYIEAKKQAEKDFKKLGLISENEDITRWYGASGGPTADHSNFAGRVGRGLTENKIYWYDDQQIMQNAKSYLDEAKLLQKSMIDQLKRDVPSEALMTSNQTKSYTKKLSVFDNIGDGVFVPNETLNNFIRKEKNSEKLTAQVNKHFKTDFKVDEVKTIQSYTDVADTASLRIYSSKREIVNLENAEKGGVNVDFAGMGSANADAVHRAIAKSNSLDELVSNARANERIVTAKFEKQKRELQNVFDNFINEKKNLGELKWKCSGDDCAGVFQQSLPENFKNELAQRLSRTERPAGARYSLVSDKVADPTLRSRIGQHGEEIEKAIRKNLSGKLPDDKLKKITLVIDMKGETSGQGAVNYFVGNSQVKLDPRDLEKIKSAFKKAVKDINQKADLFESGHGKYFSGR